MSLPIQAPKRRLYHCVQLYDKKMEARHSAAMQSWDALYSQGVIPVHVWDEDMTRTAKDIGDKRPLPYLKDVLQFAMDQAGDDDLIMFTNDDIYLHPEIVGKLMFHASVYGPCSSQRCDFKSNVPSKFTPEQIAKQGGKHMGRDMFCFTKQWLLENWDEIGDYILGASEWDLALSFMVRLHYGIKSNRQNAEQVFHPAEIERGYVAHTMHKAFWTRPDNEHVAPSQLHNRACFKAWCEKHLPDVKFHQNNVI